MDNNGFAFVDLFAGIGGLRRAMDGIGGRCVFTSEWDRFAQKTYAENYRDNHPIAGDITKIDAADIPEHDVLCAGFPCQPFSIAGVSKKNLRSHDRGKTYLVIKGALLELGYEIHDIVIDARHFLPQHRQRIVIVGFLKDTGFSFDDMNLPEKGLKKMRDALHPQDGSEAPEGHFTQGEMAKVNDKYILTDHLWQYLQNYAKKHKSAGNGFGFGLVGPDDTCRTLSARYYKDGSEILINRGEGLNPRRLTPRECARIMGYPDDFRIPVSDTQAYRQFGNSVAVPVFEEVARVMREHIHANIKLKADDTTKDAKGLAAE